MIIRFVLILLFASFGSLSGGDRWSRLDRPTSSNLRALSFVDTLWGWVAGDSGTILRTTDGGESWLDQNPGILGNIQDISMLDHSHGWAIALQQPQDTSWYGTVLLRTTNSGAIWSEHQFSNKFFLSCFFLDSVRGFLGSEGGEILATEDGGVTWTQAHIDSSIVSLFPVLSFQFLSSTYGFALGGRWDQAGVVWKTTDGGQWWRPSVESGEPLHALHFIDSLNILAVGGDFDFGSGMVQTLDGGGHWAYTYLGIWGEASALSFRTSAEGWAPLGFAGTYMVTSDTGNSWLSMYSPDSSSMFDVQFMDSTHGFMVGSKGTILRYNPILAGVNVRKTGPLGTPRLFQNYPNPFNPSTIIAYELAEDSFVSVRLFDVSGKEVRTLFSGNQSAGIHHLEVTSLIGASGIYFCELNTAGATGHFAAMKKLVLLK